MNSVILSYVVPRWRAFWFAPWPHAAPDAFRIAAGLILALYFGALIPEWAALFGADSFNPAYRNGAGTLPGLVNVFAWTEAWLPVTAWPWIGLVSGLLLAAGVASKAAQVMLFLLLASIVNGNRWIVSGEELVMRSALLLLAAYPFGRRLTLPLPWRKPAADAAVPRAWPVRLVQINVVLIYVFNLPAKLTADPVWTNGEAMYYVAANRTWNRWLPEGLLQVQGISQAMTYGSFLVELLAIPLCWLAPARPWVVLMMVGFHLTIGLAMKNVALFSLATAACWLLFLRDEDVARIWRRLRPQACPADHACALHAAPPPPAPHGV